MYFYLILVCIPSMFILDIAQAINTADEIN